MDLHKDLLCVFSNFDVKYCEVLLFNIGGGHLFKFIYEGLVSNLGSSFSRWLSNRSSVQDTSSNNVERSSIVSVDDSACREYPESPGADVEYDARGNVEEMMSQISKMTYTPKIMTASKGNRLIKRKADEDCCTPILGFSATKRSVT